ncbi:MAG: sporulation protein YqfD, partial [Christensenellales bacterium]
MRERAVICTDRLNCYRLINQLREKKIAVYDARIDDAELVFVVYGDDVGKCIELLESKKRSYRVASIRRKKTWKKIVKEHLVSSFSWFLVIVAIIIASRFCYTVEVVSDDVGLKNQVQSILVEQGYTGVFPKSKLDENSLKQSILLNTSNTAYADVELKGGKLIVSVKQAHKPMQDEARYNAIFATCDCVITKIFVESGTALVKEGDRVVKGQKLIDGYIDLKDPMDPQNVRQPVQAKGVIVGKVWQSSRLILPDKYIAMERTGNVTIANQVSFGGLTWKSKNQSPYENFEMQSHRKSTGDIIKIDLEKIIFYETTPVEKSVDRDYIDSRISSAKIEMQSQFEEGWRVVECWNFEKRLDNLYIIDIYYELEIPVWY